MAYLGDEPEKYKEHSRKIRLEYEHLSDAEYREQRLKVFFRTGYRFENLSFQVLQLFLQIPNIYGTRDFRERFEEAARRNIQAEVDALNEQKWDDSVKCDFL